MDTKEVLAAMAVALALLGLASPWWQDRFVKERELRRAAARRLRDFASRVGEPMRRPEIGLDDETSTRELLSQWRSEFAETCHDASPSLTQRTRAVIELLDHAERLGLRRDSGWIEASAYALSDYERAAAAEARGRRAGAPLLPAGDELAKLVETGQTLRRGLKPLSEAVRSRAEAIDLRRWRRRFILTTLNGALLGVSVTYLILS